MARGRMLNKKISNSRAVNDLPEPAQLLYTWLIPHLDCNGCFYGSAQMVKSLVFPRKNYSETRVEKWLKLFEKTHGMGKSPLIIRYFVEDEQYLFMPGFFGEQIGLRRDKEKPEFPSFNGKDTETIWQNDGLTGREGGGERGGEVPLSPEVEVEKKVNRKEDYCCLENQLDEIKNNDEMAVIKTMYEGEIGRITSIVADNLHNAFNQYGPERIKYAIKEAAVHNGRSWAYLKKILENDRKSRNKLSDPNKYIKGRYGHMVQR